MNNGYIITDKDTIKFDYPIVWNKELYNTTHHIWTRVCTYNGQSNAIIYKKELTSTKLDKDILRINGIGKESYSDKGHNMLLKGLKNLKKVETAYYYPAVSDKFIKIDTVVSYVADGLYYDADSLRITGDDNTALVLKNLYSGGVQVRNSPVSFIEFDNGDKYAVVLFNTICLKNGIFTGNPRSEDEISKIVNNFNKKVAQDIIKNSDCIYTKADGTSYRMLLGIACDKDRSIFLKNIAERYGQAQGNFLKQAGILDGYYNIRDFVRKPGLRIDVWAIILWLHGIRGLQLNDKTGHYRYYG